MKDIIKLFRVFFKIGILTFGGGYSMLPMIQREIVAVNGWATEEEIMDYYAIGQCTPGVIAVNTATFIGYNRKGIWGAIGATLGVITPSLIIITIIAAAIQGYADLPVVQHAFAGISAAVAMLILNAVIMLWKNGIKNILGGIIFVVAIICDGVFKIPTVFILITAIAAGIIVEFIRRHISKKEGR